MNINLSKQSSTHMKALILAVQNSEGTVVEIGSGVFSTPLLHWLCEGRRLKTYENSEKYIEFAEKFKSRTHSVSLVNSYDEVDTEGEFGVVFIDHEPIERRGADALRFKDSAKFIVLHDTNHPEQYGYDKIFDSFRYRKDYVRKDASTTILSNLCPIP